MAEMKLTNNTDLVFTDISSEIYREYNFPNGTKMRIEDPMYLNVNNGGHRVKDMQGNCYYINIKDSWWITWQSYSDKPDFVK
jgi:hypothetical protein